MKTKTKAGLRIVSGRQKKTGQKTTALSTALAKAIDAPTRAPGDKSGQPLPDVKPACVRCGHAHSEHSHRTPLGCRLCSCFFYAATASLAYHTFHPGPGAGECSQQAS